MRVLVLVDHSADLEIRPDLTIFDYMADVTSQHDIKSLFPFLDPRRVQTQLCTIYGSDTDASISLKARSRFEVLAWRRLARFLREGNFDLVHALGPTAIYYAGIVGRMTGTPSVATFYRVDSPLKKTRQDYSSMAQSMRSWLNFWVMRKTLNKGVAISELVRRDLWRSGFAEDKIELNYPGFDLPDPERILPSRSDLGLPDGPLVTMVTHFDETQSHAVFLDSLVHLHVNVPTVQVAIIGKGSAPERLRLNQQIHKRNIIPPTLVSDGVNVRDVIASSQVVVIHPFTECIPLVLIEAGAAGKPVVASRVPGVSEIVEQDVSGLLITPGDSRDMTIQIGRLLQQPKYMHDIGIRAQRRISERFALETQAHRMMIIYEETIYSTR